jgi:hypothetical protein
MSTSPQKTETVVLCLLLGALLSGSGISAQCGSMVSIGSSANILSTINYASRSVAANKDLNAVLFIHRNDNSQFPGTSSHLKYALSANAGATWTVNQGPLNPVSTSLARYPNVAIYNPPSNTNYAAAYLGYLGPTIDNVGGWNGVISGVGKLDGTGFTENYNQPGSYSMVPVAPLVQGAPGTFWSIGRNYSFPTHSNDVLVFKGVWNGSNDVSWSTNTVIPVASQGDMVYATWIAFDPSGTEGWIALAGNLTGGPSNNNSYPVFYHTTNGGTSWNGPIIFNLSQYTCITSSLGGGTPSIDRNSIALNVDKYGNPHLLTSIGTSSGFTNLDHTMWHYAFDVTRRHGFWTAVPVANILTAPHSTSLAEQALRPQVSRSADGEKIFFSWSDNTAKTLGDPNSTPQLYSRAYDVSQNKWTGIKDFSSCNAGTDGKILFHHVANEVLEPSQGVYKLAPVFGEYGSGQDGTLPAKYYFLDNCTFSAAEFTVSQQVDPIVTQPGLNAAACGNVVLQVTNTHDEIRWYNLSPMPSVTLTSGSGTYSVVTRKGCDIGSAEFTVSPLQVGATPASATVCPGDMAQFVATGNASAHVWQPAGSAGPVFTIMPAGAATYTVFGSAGTCTTSASVSVQLTVCTDISDVKINGMLVYPVPASGAITIVSGYEGDAWLVDATGNTVKQMTFSSRENSFVVSGLARGVYYLVRDDGRRGVKVVID